MFEIYSKNALSPHFSNTLYSAIFMIFAPALTNIYYTLKPNSPLANIMPVAMPIIAFSQYLHFFRRDLNQFCFSTEGEDPKILREKYNILSYYSRQNADLQNFNRKIIEFEENTDDKKWLWILIIFSLFDIYLQKIKKTLPIMTNLLFLAR